MGADDVKLANDWLGSVGGLMAVFDEWLAIGLTTCHCLDNHLSGGSADLGGLSGAAGATSALAELFGRVSSPRMGSFIILVIFTIVNCQMVPNLINFLEGNLLPVIANLCLRIETEGLGLVVH